MRLESQVLKENVTVDAAVLCTWTQGAGIPVVLLHGGPGGYDELEPVASMIEVNRTLGADFDLFCQDPKFLPRVRAFDRPALIMHGTQDLRPAWASAALTRQFPNAIYVELPGGHFPWLEAPESLRESLRGLLSAVAAVGD